MDAERLRDTALEAYWGWYQDVVDLRDRMERLYREANAYSPETPVLATPPAEPGLDAPALPSEEELAEALHTVYECDCDSEWGTVNMVQHRHEAAAILRRIRETRGGSPDDSCDRCGSDAHLTAWHEANL